MLQNTNTIEANKILVQVWKSPVKPKLNGNSGEKYKLGQLKTESRNDWICTSVKNHLGVILLILVPIVSITLLPQQTIPVSGENVSSSVEKS